MKMRFVAAIGLCLLLMTSSLMSAHSRAETNGAMPCGVDPKKLRAFDDKQVLATQQHVKFDGNAYGFRLKNGKYLQLPITIEGGGRYVLVDYLKIPGFFVLSEFYESSESSDHFTLIQDNYGVKYEVDGVPLFTSNCRRFVALDVCDMGCANLIAIWDKRGDFWKQVWSFSPYEYWIASDVKWVGNDEVLVTREVYRMVDKPDSGTVKKSFRVQLLHEGWKVFESPVVINK